MINLLIPEEKQRIKRGHTFRMLSVALMLLTTLCIVGILLLLPSYMIAETKRDIAQGKLDAIKSSEGFKNDETLNTIINDINAKVQKIGSPDDSHLYSEEIVEPVVMTKPPLLVISSMAITKEKEGTVVQITGVSENRATLLSFTQALEQLPHIQDVSVPLSEYVSGKNIPYTISFSVKE
ncbi:hypothetical protein IPF86_01300 [Candidatus Nomurabacteria bacterium]|jgi:hypothetical protein|nr:MAG: hypothetical protein IPF86_01300 [Candidatus Nomurabacteria bacterium]